MGMGLLGHLLRLAGRTEPFSQVTRPGAPCCRLFLESLETRTLPSVLIPSPKVPSVDGYGLVADTGSQNDPGSGDAASQDNGGQANSSGQDPGTSGNALVATDAVTQLTIQSVQLQLQTITAGAGQGDKSQGQDQGDAQNGQGDGTDPGLTDGSDPGNPPANGDNGGQDAQNDPTSGQNGQDNSSNPGSDATNDPTDANSGSQIGQNDPSTSSPSHCHGDNHHHHADTGSNSSADHNPAPPAGAGTNTDSDAGLASTSHGTAIPSAADGTNGTANGDGSGPDKKHHSQSNDSTSEVEHVAVSAPDGKQHGSDGNLVSGEELHSLVSSAIQAPEQSSRYQAGVPSSLNGPLEDPGPRQAEERFPPADVFQKFAVVEVASTAADEIRTPVANDVSDDTPQDLDQPNLSPQNHGLLIDSLSLNFSSLRSEVENFFEQIDNLGGHPSDKQIGMILSSGAMVVAAAMACEIARRQARRPASGSTFASACAEAASATGLPNFGRFSAFS